MPMQRPQYGLRDPVLPGLAGTSEPEAWQRLHTDSRVVLAQNRFQVCYRRLLLSAECRVLSSRALTPHRGVSARALFSVIAGIPAMSHGKVEILTWNFTGTRSDNTPSGKQNRCLPI